MSAGADEWGRISELVAACLLAAPERAGEVDPQDIAGGPSRNLVQELRRRLASKRPVDFEGLLASGDEALGELGGREHLLTLHGEPVLAADLERYLTEARRLAVDDGLRRSLGNGGPPAALLRQYADRLDGPVVGDEPSSWVPVDLFALAGPPPEPALLRGSAGALVYPGKRHVFSGLPESMKSWLAAVVAVEVLEEEEPVVWIDADGMGGQAILERLRLLGAKDDLIADLFTFISPWERPGAGEIEGLVAHGPALAVLDSVEPAAALLGLDTNSSGDVEQLMQALINPFHRAGVTTVQLDHVPKNPDTRGNFSIGSQRKLAAPEVQFGLRVIGQPLTRTGGRAVVEVTINKDRPAALHRGPGGAAGRVVFTAEPGGRIMWNVEIDTHEREGFRPTALMERVSRHLEVQPQPVSARAVTDDVKGRGEDLRTALRVLVAEDFVEATEGERKSILHRSIRPYRQADDPLSDVFEAPPEDHRVRPRPTASGPRSMSASPPRRGDALDLGRGQEPSASRDEPAAQQTSWAERLTVYGEELETRKTAAEKGSQP